MQCKRSVFNLQSFHRFKFCNLKIGLFGGSFNPPHYGHVTISRLALNLLKLDYVIWLISPQNIFKDPYEYSTEERIELVLDKISHPKILVSAIELELGYDNTYQILKYLIARFPNIQFTWIAGADSIAEMHRWRQGNIIPSLVNIAIFARPKYIVRGLKSRIVIKNQVEFLNYQGVQKTNKILTPRLGEKRIIFLQQRLLNISSTDIRGSKK